MSFEFLLLCTLAAADGPTVSNQEVGPLKVRVEAPKQLVLSEKLILSVTISAPESASVYPPKLKPGQSVAGMPILAIKVQGPDRIAGKFATVLVQNWSLELEPLQRGRVEPGSIAVEWKVAGQPGGTGAILLPGVEVVPGTAAGDDPATLRELEQSPVGKTFGKALPRVLTYSGIGLLTGIALLWFSMKPVAKESPLESATRRLAELETSSPGSPRQRIDEACALLRDYLATRYGLRAEAMTAREFLADNATRSSLSAARTAALAEFLESADLDRFPEREPDAVAAERCLRRARAFLAGEPR